MKKTRLFLVDDHQIMLDGIRALLKDEPSIYITGTATDGAQALSLLKISQPDVVLTDLQMPGMNGNTLIRQMRKDFPQVHIIVLSMSNDEATIAGSFDAGVKGYVLKNTGKEELLSAIRTVMNQEIFMNPELNVRMSKYLANRSKFSQADAVKLTARELEIVQLIAREYSNEKIAAALFISERTVETHRKNIFRKTSTKGVVGLLRWVNERGLIQP